MENSLTSLYQRYRGVLLFTALYTLAFAAYFISTGDPEFIWYVAVLVFFVVIIAATLRRTKFDGVILWGLSIWGLLHLAGGAVPVGDGVLYGMTLIPLVDAGGELTLLKYDQAVHFFGFGVATLVVYHLLRPHLTAGGIRFTTLAIAALAGAGLGVLNEIVEFVAVLSFPETGVGGYNNTALDLVFNTFGAIVAVLYIAMVRERRVYSERVPNRRSV